MPAHAEDLLANGEIELFWDFHVPDVTCCRAGLGTPGGSKRDASPKTLCSLLSVATPTESRGPTISKGNAVATEKFGFFGFRRTRKPLAEWH
jgi:hypothetical protein